MKGGGWGINDFLCEKEWISVGNEDVCTVYVH